MPGEPVACASGIIKSLSPGLRPADLTGDFSSGSSSSSEVFVFLALINSLTNTQISGRRRKQSSPRQPTATFMLVRSLAKQANKQTNKLNVNDLEKDDLTGHLDKQQGPDGYSLIWAWGSAYKSHIKKIQTKQNHALRLILFARTLERPSSAQPF